MADGTGTTSASVEKLVTISALEAHAAHRGTDAILALLRSGGGEEDPDDQAVAIAELLMAAEERDADLAASIATVRGILEVVGETVAKVREEQAQAAARESQLRQDVLALKERLEQFLGLIRIVPPAASKAD